jgi:hypothetical protein
MCALHGLPPLDTLPIANGSAISDLCRSCVRLFRWESDASEELDTCVLGTPLSDNDDDDEDDGNDDSGVRNGEDYAMARIHACTTPAPAAIVRAQMVVVLAVSVSSCIHAHRLIAFRPS